MPLSLLGYLDIVDTTLTQTSSWAPYNRTKVQLIYMQSNYCHSVALCISKTKGGIIVDAFRLSESKLFHALKISKEENYLQLPWILLKKYDIFSTFGYLIISLETILINYQIYFK